MTVMPIPYRGGGTRLGVVDMPRPWVLGKSHGMYILYLPRCSTPALCRVAELEHSSMLRMNKRCTTTTVAAQCSTRNICSPAWILLNTAQCYSAAVALYGTPRWDARAVHDAAPCANFTARVGHAGSCINCHKLQLQGPVLARGTCRSLQWPYTTCTL
jgi:hypothetical protein